MALAGLAGTFGGKFAVDKFLVQERIDKYKSDFKTQVSKQFLEMKFTTDFSETVRKQVFSAFEGLKSKIESETEIILRDTQKTLDNLNSLKAEKKEVSEKEMDRLHGIAEEASNILQNAYVLRRALTGTGDF